MSIAHYSNAFDKRNYREQRKMDNKTKLLNHFLSIHAVPPGGGLEAGLRYFMDDAYRKEVIKKAMAELELSIAAVKNAPDNPYGDDDNVIAGEILEQIERRKKERKEE